MMLKDRVFAILKNDGGYVSGEKISELLGVSRAAVNSAIKTLRDDGYIIPSATNRGYMLEGGPDLLNAGELLARLGGERMESVICLDTVDSTNTYLRNLALDGGEDGLVVCADCQTGGRGRRGRAFLSPGGVGVYMSALIRPRSLPEDTAALTAWTAEAMCRAAQEACGVRPGIKWVNDLIMNGRKVAGILTEMSVESESGSVQYVISGVGFNVNQLAEDFPPELRSVASSLRQESGGMVCRAALAAAMIRAFDALRADFPEKQDQYLQNYRRDCLTTGRRVLLTRGDMSREAFAEGVDDGFGLLVRYDDGTSETVSSGEVSVRGLMGYA